MDQRDYLDNPEYNAKRAYDNQPKQQQGAGIGTAGCVSNEICGDMQSYHRQREQEIRDRFNYKAPKGDQVARYQALRTGFANLAVLILQNTRPGQGQEIALQNLQIVSMITNKAIADEY